MTNKETQGNKGTEQDCKTANWFKTQRKAVKEYKAFCDMDEQTLEMYTAYRLPTPPKNQPFTEEYPDPQTNPLLTEMREAAKAARTASILAHTRSLLAHLLIITTVFLCNGWTWLYIVLGTFLVVDQIITAMLLWGDRIAFAKSYAYVESLASPDSEPEASQTWWNFKRWEKWALARYDFESEQELIGALMKEEFVHVETESGRLLLSSATGEEWPLKPELDEISKPLLDA